MKLSKYCVLLAFVLFFAYDSFAQNAVLNSCYVVHKDKDLEGKKDGIRFHLNLTVNGQKNQKVWCIIEMAYYEGDRTYYFTHSKGSYEYNGHLAVYQQLRSPYESSTWKDLQLFLPYQEFRNSIGEREDWKKGITYCVKVVDIKGNVLFQEWQTSKRIGYAQHIYPVVPCQICNGTGRCNICYGTGTVALVMSVVRCSFCFGTGKCRNCEGKGCKKQFSDAMLTYDIQVNNGNSISATPYYYYDNTPVPSVGGSNTKPDYTCPICHGTGKCTSCAGRGIKENSIMFESGVHECGSCNGSGQCSFCYGRGYTYK